MRWHRGQSMAEYALILGAIAVVCMLGYQTLGTTVKGLLTNVNNLF
jgi:Flp pilus assembly pilin Flp